MKNNILLLIPMMVLLLSMVMTILIIDNIVETMLGANIILGIITVGVMGYIIVSVVIKDENSKG